MVAPAPAPNEETGTKLHTIIATASLIGIDKIPNNCTVRLVNELTGAESTGSPKASLEMVLQPTRRGKEIVFQAEALNCDIPEPRRQVSRTVSVLNAAFVHIKSRIVDDMGLEESERNRHEVELRIWPPSCNIDRNETKIRSKPFPPRAIGGEPRNYLNDTEIVRQPEGENLEAAANMIARIDPKWHGWDPDRAGQVKDLINFEKRESKLRVYYSARYRLFADVVLHEQPSFRFSIDGNKMTTVQLPKNEGGHALFAPIKLKRPILQPIPDTRCWQVEWKPDDATNPDGPNVMPRARKTKHVTGQVIGIVDRGVFYGNSSWEVSETSQYRSPGIAEENYHLQQVKGETADGAILGIEHGGLGDLWSTKGFIMYLKQKLKEHEKASLENKTVPISMNIISDEGTPDIQVCHPDFNKRTQIVAKNLIIVAKNLIKDAQEAEAMESQQRYNDDRACWMEFKAKEFVGFGGAAYEYRHTYGWRDGAIWMPKTTGRRCPNYHDPKVPIPTAREFN